MTTPSYKTHDPKGFGGDPKRGAALGRDSLHAEDPALFVCTLTVQRVELIDGYDENGTYFGDGEPLFWCASECGEVDFMLRAVDRQAAIVKVKAQYPLGTIKPYSADGGMRAVIKRRMTRIAWCMAWSDHVEEYCCANLSGCEITECAPEAPSELEADAEKALTEIEKRCAAHGPLVAATAEAIAWLRAYSERSDDGDALLDEAAESPIVGALLVAAKADAETGQDEESKPFEHPTSEAWSLLLESDEYAAEFGSCLAHSLVGSGISWSDDHEEVPLPDIYSTTHLPDTARYLADQTCDECRLPAEIEAMRDEKTGALPAFAWPGGYTLLYATKQGNVLCSECAGQLRRYDDKVTDVSTYDEGSDLECDGDGCSNVLESSYGDPEEEEVEELTADVIKTDFEASDHCRDSERYQYDYEHDAWWITELGTGRTWKVNQIFSELGAEIDLEYEVITEGDGSSAPESEEE